MAKILKLTFLFLVIASANASELENIFKSATKNLILIGESHKDDKSREDFSASLTVFKKSGGEILGLEMIESHQQILLDNFEANLAGAASELSEYLTRRWQYNTESYMKLIIEARRLDLRLIAIDLDKTKWPAETTIYPVIPDVSKVRAAREEHMSKILCEYKEVKTVVLIGSFHTLERFLPTAIKKSCDLQSLSVTLKELKKFNFPVYF